jgi:hypothetical protein
MAMEEGVEGVDLFLLFTSLVGKDSAGTDPLACSSGLRVTIRLIGLAGGLEE